MAGFLEFFRPAAAVKANRAQTLVDTVIGGFASPKYKDYASYLGAFKSPWVKACVSVIAYNAANVSYRLLSGPQDGKDTKEIAASPLLDLLARPNPTQTGFELLEATWIDLELTGNCFWALEELDGRGRPAELYRLRPDSVTVLPDPVRLVSGYVYTTNGRAIRYAPEELHHHRYPNPLSDLYGMGTIEAGEARFDSELAMAEHERQFWRNGAKITGVLSTDNTIDDTTFDRVAGTIRNFFRGSGYATLMLENGLKYQSVSDGPAKLGMLEMSKASRDMILAMFGVPPTKLGILENANYKATASDEFFWTETVDPKLTRLEQSLQRLVELFHPGQGYRFCFDRLNFTDDLPTMTVAEMMARSGSATVNEIRSYRGEEPLGPEGDVVLVPNSLTTLDALAAPPAPPVVAPTLLRALPESAAKRLLRVGGAAPASAALVARHRDRLIATAERDHAGKVAEAFAAQEGRALAALGAFKRRKSALTVDALLPDDDDALTAPLRAIHLAASEAAYQTAADLGVSVSFDLANPLLDQFTTDLGQRIVGIGETTRQGIGEQIAEGLRRGYSIDQIARGVPGEDYKGIGGVFDDAKGYRAKMIARTETMAAYQGAALLAYDQAGIRNVELLDGTDHEPCSSRNGKVVSVAEAKTIRDHPNGTLCVVPLIA